MEKRKVIFMSKKATQRFLDDVDGPVEGIEFDCLKPHVGTSTILLSVPEHLQRDVDVFPLRNIDGPLKVIPLKGGKWDVPEYQQLKEKFERVVKLDRKALAATLE